MMFSEEYGQLRVGSAEAREGSANAVSETVLQCIWYDQLFSEEGLRTDDGRTLKVHSPGWWNRSEGPDFKGAQLEFDGELLTGDVEIHFTHGAWTQHGHHLDDGYNEVLLIVVLESVPPRKPPVTAACRRIPTLSLSLFLESDIRDIAGRLAIEDYPYRTPAALGKCSSFVASHGDKDMLSLIGLAGEWRMLNKARRLRERMERVGADQAVYEAFLSACGFSHFKHHFRAIARQFHYPRVRQLARQDPMLVETAFLQIAGLLPDALPEGTTAVPHFARLRALRRDRLSGLKSLPLTWRRTGIRPNNNPERRLAGAALFLSRTAREGLVATLEDVWAADVKALARRRVLEGLFPAPVGFWAEHCTWSGKRMSTANAPIGPGRVRSIIGNVFVPAALAIARRERDRRTEERVLDFFSHLPKEPSNQVITRMTPRLLGAEAKPRLTFRMQQGLLQLHQDWCESNPSCRNCTVVSYLRESVAGGRGVGCSGRG